MEETYYKKILVTSGQVPENEGWQDTNRGPVQWANGIWQLSRNNIIPVTYFYKQASVPSPKQEIEQLLEDYKRRLHAVNQMIATATSVVTLDRLETKASCYRTIITELERILKE